MLVWTIHSPTAPLKQQAWVTALCLACQPCRQASAPAPLPCQGWLRHKVQRDQAGQQPKATICVSPCFPTVLSRWSLTHLWNVSVWTWKTGYHQGEANAFKMNEKITSSNTSSAARLHFQSLCFIRHTKNKSELHSKRDALVVIVKGAFFEVENLFDLGWY